MFLTGDSSDNYTPLLYASFYGHEACVKLLLRLNASLEWFGSDGATPLVAASQEGHTSVVKILVEAAGDYSARSRSGSLHPVMDYVMPDGRSVLFMAAENDKASVIKLLVSARANINVAGSQVCIVVPLLVVRSVVHRVLNWFVNCAPCLNGSAGSLHFAGHTLVRCGKRWSRSGSQSPFGWPCVHRNAELPNSRGQPPNNCKGESGTSRHSIDRRSCWWPSEYCCAPVAKTCKHVETWCCAGWRWCV